MRIYYIGIKKEKKSIIIQAVRDKDFLDCEIYEYYGEREVTKKQLHENRFSILQALQERKPEVYSGFRRIRVE